MGKIRGRGWEEEVDRSREGQGQVSEREGKKRSARREGKRKGAKREAAHS